ncbi:MAG: hypothetical protein AAF197_11035, partial [Pseudomonadota bacterium]
MSDLQLIFLCIGALLFGAIALYSWLQSNQGGHNRNQRRKRMGDDLQSLNGAADQLVGSDKIAPSVETNIDDAKAELESEQAISSPEELAETTDIEESSSVDFLKESPSNKPNLFQRSAAKISGLTKSAPSPLPESSPPETQVDKPGPKPDLVYSAEDVPLDDPIRAEGDGSIITELVARINVPQAIEQKELVSLLREHDYKFRRQIHLYGLNQLTDIWCDLEQELPSALFVDLGLSIQLADREGPMSSKESHDFQQMVLEFTDRFDAPFQFSMDIDAALDQARRLDRIGNQYDSLAVLNIVPRARTGFRFADVESCARDLVMSTDRDGIFVKTAGQRNNMYVLYRLACTDGEG